MHLVSKLYVTSYIYVIILSILQKTIQLRLVRGYWNGFLLFASSRRRRLWNWILTINGNCNPDSLVCFEYYASIFWISITLKRLRLKCIVNSCNNFINSILADLEIWAHLMLRSLLNLESQGTSSQPELYQINLSTKEKNIKTTKFVVGRKYFHHIKIHTTANHARVILVNNNIIYYQF